MKLRRVTLLLSIALLLPALAWALPKVAVLDLSVQKGIDATVVGPVTESIMEEVVGARAYVVLDRAYIDQVLKEKEFELAGMVSDSQVAQAGQYLGADYVVAGKIQLIGDTYFVVAKMIEVKTGVIVAQSSEQGEGKLAVLLGIAHSVGRKLVTGAPISALSPTPPSPVSPIAAGSAASAAPVEQAQPPASEAVLPASFDQIVDPQPRGRVKLSILVMRGPAVGDSAVWQGIMDGFHQKYPSIEVAADYIDDAGLYYRKLSLAATSGKMPDIFMLGMDRQIGSVYPAKDLKPLLKGREALFLSPAIDYFTERDSLQCLPATLTASHVVYANGELLGRLGLQYPRTLDELLGQAAAIRAAGLTPIALADKDGWQLQSCLFSVLEERTGGRGWLLKALKGRGTSFTDSSFVAALGVIQQLAAARMFPPNMTSLDYDAGFRLFQQGKAVYLVDGEWRGGPLMDQLPPALKDALVVGTFPDLPGQSGPPGSTSAVLTGYAMNGALSGDRAAAAWLWLWYCCGPEGQRIRFEHGTMPAMHPRMFEDAVDPVWSKLFDLMASAPLVEILDSWMGDGTINAELQSIVLGKKRPDAAARDIESWVARNDPNRRSGR